VAHTCIDAKEQKDMLSAIGIKNIDDLFCDIPASISISNISIAKSKNEMQTSSYIKKIAEKNVANSKNFAGGGAYDHYIPAVVPSLISRGEFYTSYTPYQAECSQGTLQVIYEFQSKICALTGLDVANASLYDGASACAEAALMAARINKKNKNRNFLVPRALNPDYIEAIQTIISGQGFKITLIDFDIKTGTTILPTNTDAVALIIPQINYFGNLEDIDSLCDFASQNNMLSIALTNPLSLAILKSPHKWGKSGADICAGEAQSLGIPLSSGGPYLGFMACKKEYMRQMPGRIVGKTTDRNKKPGFVLTLQAREQHIRRSKATSNICTNQGLMATAATIYLGYQGERGMIKTAEENHNNAQRLQAILQKNKYIKILWQTPFFNEFVVVINALPINEIITALSNHNIVAGISLENNYKEIKNSLLVTATEKTDEEDMYILSNSITKIIQLRTKNTCNLRPKNDDS
jgi:glycine dehydrogenase subunit 1